MTPQELCVGVTFSLTIGLSVAFINSQLDSTQQFKPSDIAANQTPLRWLEYNHTLAIAFQQGFSNAPPTDCTLAFASFNVLNTICEPSYGSPETAAACVNGVLCGTTSYTVKAKYECDLRSSEDPTLGAVSGLLASIVLLPHITGLSKWSRVGSQCTPQMNRYSNRLFGQTSSYGTIDPINQPPVTHTQTHWCFFITTTLLYFTLITITSIATAAHNKASFKNSDWSDPAQTPCSFQQDIGNHTAMSICIDAFNKASEFMQHQNWPAKYPLLNETDICDDQYPCINGLRTGLMAGITNLYLQNESDSNDATIAVYATILVIASHLTVWLYRSKSNRSEFGCIAASSAGINA